MSVFSALNVAVNGLNAQSRAFANISDNLANTETVGYKRVATSFQSLVTSSNSSINNPGGVKATPQYQNSLQGNLTQVDSDTSLAISGAGFFAVRKAITNGDGSTTFGDETFYTRRGDYTLSKDGYLTNGANYYLTGYEVDSDGTVNTAAVSPIRISQLLDDPVATSRMTYAANLPAGKPSTYASPSSTINVYDQLGAVHEIQFTWDKLGTESQASWELEIRFNEDDVANVSIAGIDLSATDLTMAVPFNFQTSGDAAGTLSAYGTGSGAGIEPGSGYSVTDPLTTTPVGKALVSFTVEFAGAGTQTIVVDFGSYEASGGVTQYADTDLQVTSFEQNGIPRGSFESISVDKNGFVSLNYDNGSSKIFYQVPIVQFNSPNNLQREEGNAFSQTIDSGTPRYSAANTLGAGQLIGNALESSNVDIATEFTTMIKYQRVYSANARVISSANSMLEDVINVVR